MLKFCKYICIFSLFLFKPNAALAGGGFSASCKNIHLYNNNNWLEADC